MEIHVTLALLLIIYPERTGSASRCPSYPDPKNGYVTCDSLFHLFCSPECHPGYRFATKPAVVYMCGPVTGEWFTYPVGSSLPWPDCVPEDRSDDTIHQELAKKREEITRYIAHSNTGIPTPYSQARSLDPEERYHHLFDYIERAEKAYEYRETIEKETEKLKHENIHPKENISNKQSRSYENRLGSYQPWSYTSKTTAKNVEAGKEFALNAHGSGFPKVDLQQTLVSQKEHLPLNIQSAGYKTYLSPVTNKIPDKNERWNEKGTFTGQLSEGSPQVNSQIQTAGNFQMNNATPSMAKAVEENTSPYKQDSNFVLKMLNNEEFKDLHYLDEHVRRNRGAPASINRNTTKSKSSLLENDRMVGTMGSRDQHLEITRGDSKNDSRDVFALSTDTESKENANLSRYVEPIVMSRTSLINSVASLLKNAKVINTNTTGNRRIFNLKDEKEQKQQRNLMKPVIPPNFSSIKNDFLLINKSKVENGNTMKDLYDSWIKENRESLNSHVNGQQRKYIASQTNALLWRRLNPLSVENVNRSSVKNRTNEVKSQGREKNEGKRPVREHLFYFPIKKNTLIDILNHTNLILKP